MGREEVEGGRDGGGREKMGGGRRWGRDGGVGKREGGRMGGEGSEVEGFGKEANLFPIISSQLASSAFVLTGNRPRARKWA